MTKTTTPNDQTSAFSPKYSLELSSSGAMKFGVPQITLSFLDLFAEIKNKITQSAESIINQFKFFPIIIILINFDKDILWLDISVHDVLVMKVNDSLEKLFREIF